MSNQMIRFGETLKAYAEGREPEHYPSEQNRLMALEIAENAPENASVESWARWGGNRYIAQQKADLKAFGCEFDTWFRESSLHTTLTELTASNIIQNLCAQGKIYLHVEGKEPICDNCATVLVLKESKNECYPCPLCTEGLVLGVRADLPSLKDMYDEDSLEDSGYKSWRKGGCAIHPDNDFIEENQP